MEKVKMVTQVAGEEVFVGECHPARARVLVKKQIASWLDGKVLLHVLNVHDKLLASNPDAWHGPLDDGNVSKQEMERRTAWFRSFMEKSSRALVAGTVELPSEEELQQARAGGYDVLFDGESRNQVMDWLVPALRALLSEEDFDIGDVGCQVRLQDIRTKVVAEVVKAGVPDSWQIMCDLMDFATNLAIPDEEVAGYFEDVPLGEPAVDPQLLWEVDPDVSAVFGGVTPVPLFETMNEDGVPEMTHTRANSIDPSTRVDGMTTPSLHRSAPVFDRQVYEKQLARDVVLAEGARAALYEETPRLVASIRQVQALHSRPLSGKVTVRLSTEPSAG